MSMVVWSGDKLIQAVGDTRAELGYIKLDESTGRYVLWLKAHGTGHYVRGEEFNTQREARQRAAISSAASYAHMSWLFSLPIRHGFLALQFDSVEVEHLANEHIRPVVKEELGYNLLDLRDVSKAGVIDEILCETIRKSEFMIADLTDGNNGVYWEAGFAEGARIPVIYICERSKFEAKKTHFDTNHRTTIMWSSGESDPFEGKLVDTIRRTVEQGSHRES